MSRVDASKFSLPQFRPENTWIARAPGSLRRLKEHLRDFDLSSTLKTTSLEIVPRVSILLLKEADVLHYVEAGGRNVAAIGVGGNVAPLSTEGGRRLCSTWR